MKKDIYIVILSFLTWVICLGGCERDRNGDPIEIVFKNSSSDTICSVTQFNYPDTNLINYKTATSEVRATIIPPHSEDKFLALTGWEREIKMRNSNATLILVVYSHDSLKKII